MRELPRVIEGSTPAIQRVIAGKYDVLGILGEGGTGIVYDAIRRSDKRAVALKVMHEALAGDQQVRGRFQREATILRRLEGAHVCPILDFGEVPPEGDKPSLLYIALPKIAGPSLAEVMAKSPLPVDRALDILGSVLSALTSAHQQGVIHRDLKPANVLLENGDKVIVVDFGMSKIVTGGGLGTTNLTTHNMLFGTPEYMSPEQARGDDLDARCDVYACGVMLYEMLTGAPPFVGASPLNVLTAHLTSDLEPPSKRTTDVGRISPALEAVVLHALARDRDDRYASAADLAFAIARARVAPNDLAAVKPSVVHAAAKSADAFAATVPASPSGPPARERLDDVDATAATLLSASPASAPPPKISVKPERQRAPLIPSRPPPPPASSRLWILVWVIVGAASVGVGVYFALR